MTISAYNTIKTALRAKGKKMTTWFYCVEITCSNLQGGDYTYKEDGTITSSDSVEDVINHIKDINTQKTKMGNALGKAVLIAFNKV